MKVQSNSCPPPPPPRRRCKNKLIGSAGGGAAAGHSQKRLKQVREHTQSLNGGAGVRDRAAPLRPNISTDPYLIARVGYSLQPAPSESRFVCRLLQHFGAVGRVRTLLRE